MAWLREIAWPFQSAVLDGEACARDGREGIQPVFIELSTPDHEFVPGFMTPPTDGVGRRLP
jgi:hypothetical protein